VEDASSGEGVAYHVVLCRKAVVSYSSCHKGDSISPRLENSPGLVNQNTVAKCLQSVAQMSQSQIRELSRAPELELPDPVGLDLHELGLSETRLVSVTLIKCFPGSVTIMDCLSTHYHTWYV